MFLSFGGLPLQVRKLLLVILLLEVTRGLLFFFNIYVFKLMLDYAIVVSKINFLRFKHLTWIFKAFKLQHIIIWIFNKKR